MPELIKLYEIVATIRRYDQKDLTEVVPLWYRTWHETYPHIQHPQPYTDWVARFHDDLAVQGKVWVAEVENRIVAFAVILKKKQRLDQLFVDPTYQNRGIGSSLINKAKEICSQGLTLQTLQQNTQACRFYEKHGFKAGQLTTNKINGQPNVEYNWIP